jgi:phage terminase small subunit
MTDEKPKESAYFRLRRRQQKFVDAYVECGNGAESIRRLGFRGTRPDTAAWKLLARADIQAAVNERSEQAIAEAGVTQVQIVRELARVAFFDHRKLFDADGKLIATHQLPDDLAAGLAGIEIVDLGDGDERSAGRLSKYRAWPKVEALKLLLQYKKLLVEKHEHTGKDGAALAPPVINIGFANGGPGQPGRPNPGA